jgi:Lysozyme like domain
MTNPNFVELPTVRATPVGPEQPFPIGGIQTVGSQFPAPTPSPGNVEPAPMPPVNSGSPPTNQGLTGLSFAQVENFWIQAGGSPQAAAMAAAVADAESGLNAAAQRTNPDGTTSIGLWLIPANGTPPGSTDPLANARAAVQLSQNGTDWSQWCSTWSDNNCGENNGTYLGQGSNALMSLGTQSPGATYNQFGSAPAGSGVGASSATSGLTGSSGTSTKSKLPLLIGGLVIGVLLIWWLVNRKKEGKDTVEPETEQPQ